MTTILIYHDTETLARRSRAPATGETIGYAAIKDWNTEYNAKFDEVIDLSTPKPTKGKSNVGTNTQ